MAMTEEQIRASIRAGFGHYNTKVGRASLMLGNRLALSEREMHLAGLDPTAISQILHAEGSPIVDRLVNRILELHPSVPLIATSS